MSIWCGRRSKRECARSRSADRNPPPTPRGRVRCARGYRIRWRVICRLGIIRPPRGVFWLEGNAFAGKPSAGAMESEMQFIEGLRQLSARELGLLGMNDVAYVKLVDEDGTKGFS